MGDHNHDDLRASLRAAHKVTVHLRDGEGRHIAREYGPAIILATLDDLDEAHRECSRLRARLEEARLTLAALDALEDNTARPGDPPIADLYARLRRALAEGQP